jgi:hypothetical protein
MAKKKWTNKRLAEATDSEILLSLCIDRKKSLTNVNSPYYKRLCFIESNLVEIIKKENTVDEDTNKHMDKTESFEILKEFANYTIKEIYDTYDDATSALYVVLPTFEYPDWDYHTVAAFLRANGCTI